MHRYPVVQLLLTAKLAIALLVIPAFAQQSANFKLTEQVLNAGGHPSGGVVMASASFKVTLDALGESVVQGGMASASFRMNAGFATAYSPPPGEVVNLVFADTQTLNWSAVQGDFVYDLYRDDTRDDYGNCEQRDLPVPLAIDTSEPAVGNAFFYLVTVKNRLWEEGTKGFRSGEIERTGAANLPVCP